MTRLPTTIALGALLPVTAALTACSTTPKEGPNYMFGEPDPIAVEATEAQVEDCEFLRTVYAGRGIGATVFSNKESMRVARNKLLVEAGKIDGTHVVILSLDGNAAGGASASGRAYRCEDSAEQPATKKPS